LSTIVLVIYILAAMASILAVSMTNPTSDGDRNGADEKVSNTNSSSDPEENNTGEITNVPKCLGSALCPD
jgi:hypothetical protein